MFAPTDAPLNLSRNWVLAHDAFYDQIVLQARLYPFSAESPI